MLSPTEFARTLLEKASDDRYVLEHLASDKDAPEWILGFHAQQAVEKALKAVLLMREVEFPRTHNLSMLLELLHRNGVDLPAENADLAKLIPFGVLLRYEDAAGEAPSLDRSWAIQRVAKTLEWAASIVGAVPD